MQTRWRFWGVRPSHKGFWVKRNSEHRELIGSPAEALVLAARIKEFFGDRVLRVDARKRDISEVRVDGMESLKRLRILPHPSGRGHVLQVGRDHNIGWWLDLEGAINYAAFFAQGYVTVIDVVNKTGPELLVLIDQTWRFESKSSPRCMQIGC
jgi:hypothetical protein